MSLKTASGVPIGPGTRVRLRFSLLLDTNELIDSTGDQGAEFTVGDGNLLPGFERVMYGLKSGDNARFEIPSDEGFGHPKDENIQRIKRSAFAPDISLEPGLVVSFSDAQNTELPGVVKGVENELVEVDFNHPLAGRDLIFEVQILDVMQVSNEIVRM